MNIPKTNKVPIRIARWDAEEIYDENGVLVGYIERQGELQREIPLDTYDVELFGDYVGKNIDDPRLNDL